MQSEQRLHRIERATDLPLLVLALAMIPLLVLPATTNMTQGWKDAFEAANWFIWAAFAVDYGIKLAVAPRRLHYVRGHWLELLVVVLPFLRPLRFARLLRGARVAVALGLNFDLLHDITSQRGTKVIVAAVVATLVVGSTIVLLAERNSEGANIDTFDDALWWGVATMTTVGYGDRVPVSPMGRGVAVALMLFGIAAVSALTATVAAYLVREGGSQADTSMDDLMAELRLLRAELAELRGAAPPPITPAAGTAPAAQ